MAEQVNCPACGAVVETGGRQSVVCPFCGTHFEVEEHDEGTSYRIVGQPQDVVEPIKQKALDQATTIKDEVAAQVAGTTPLAGGGASVYQAPTATPYQGPVDVVPPAAPPARGGISRQAWGAILVAVFICVIAACAITVAVSSFLNR